MPETKDNKKTTAQDRARRDADAQVVGGTAHKDVTKLWREVFIREYGHPSPEQKRQK